MASAGGNAKAADQSSVVGTLREKVYLGLTTSYRVLLDNGVELNVRAVSDGGKKSAPAPGAKVRVKWQQGSARLHVG